MESAKSALTKEKKRVLKAEKAIKEAENATKEAEKTAKEADKIAIELQKKLTVTETRDQEAASWALAEFQSLKKYEDELTDASVDVYQLRFAEYKK